MSEGPITLKRLITIVYLLLIHVLAVAFIVERFVLPHVNLTQNLPTAVSDPTQPTGIPTPLPVPEEFYEPPADNSNVALSPPAATDSPANPGGSLNLIIPVAGIKSEQLQDTFTASRSGGRVHDAIDIMAPAGAPVLAAAEGKIIKFHESVPGGITIYEQSADGKYVYYYAHLQKRADGLKEGDLVTQGKTIGYVGDTGNAGPGNYHLHFSLFEVTDPKRLWEGRNLNPYPLLKNAPH